MTCEHPVQRPGDCCPYCEDDPCDVGGNATLPRAKGCTYLGRLYQTGEKVPIAQDPCTSCKCTVPICEHLVSNTGYSFHRTGSSAACTLQIALAILALWQHRTLCITGWGVTPSRNETHRGAVQLQTTLPRGSRSDASPRRTPVEERLRRRRRSA